MKMTNRGLRIAVVALLVMTACGRSAAPAPAVQAGEPNAATSVTPADAPPLLASATDTAAAPVATTSANDAPLVVITGFEGMDVAFGGNVGVYGGAEPNWDFPGAKSWFVTPGDAEYSGEMVHGGKQSFRIKWSPDKAEWATFVLLLGPMFEGKTRPRPADLAGFQTLSFWVKAEQGGEEFQPLIRTASASGLEADVKGPVYKANTTWTRYTLDLPGLLGTKTQVEMVGLRVGKEPLDKGVIYTDDWELER